MSFYNKENPFLSKVKKKKRLSSSSSEKNTQHIELDIAGSGFSYEVGDCVAILPLNDEKEVADLVKYLNLSGNEEIETRKGEKKLLLEFLLKEANLSKPNRKLLALLEERSTNYRWGREEELVKEFLRKKSVLEILQEADEVSVGAQEIVDVLLPLMPRFYSIASSQKAHPHEVHLTVAMHSYVLDEQEKLGVCSKFLLGRIQEQSTLSLYLHKHRGFTLPKDLSSDIIMIGPGTGIAPFRGFLQERLHTKASGRNWLFFGEWHKEHTFYYGEWLTEIAEDGKLHLDCAFSRDQTEKVYVQHKMKEKSAELYRWIQEGAYLYVCGDAKKMAKQVEEALLEIIGKEGSMNPKEAKQYLRSLAKTGRYLKDVY